MSGYLYVGPLESRTACAGDEDTQTGPTPWATLHRSTERGGLQQDVLASFTPGAAYSRQTRSMTQGHLITVELGHLKGGRCHAQRGSDPRLYRRRAVALPLRVRGGLARFRVAGARGAARTPS